MKKQKGITLVALIITIIILLILAGISIQALTNQGLFAQAEEAKKRTENAQKEEDEILKNYLEQMNEITGKNDKSATNITEAQSDDMLTKRVNSPIQDAYGNKITIPAGFKIKADDTTNNATTVDKGIVIIDSDENEFVWIPTGTIYTDVAKTEANAKTINLSRYTFDSNGNPTAQNDSVINSYWQELATSTYGNITAKDINDFKTKASATQSGGFYIGRYEARTGTARSTKTDPPTKITENGSQYVYNYVTQPEAADLARNMYGSDKPFTSDLVNSYAWDTATLFLQTFGDNPTYSRQSSINTGSIAKTGTNDTIDYTGTQDVQCNVYDMASNLYEWTTETGSDSIRPCSCRGGLSADKNCFTSIRGSLKPTDAFYDLGFRPILYVYS